jgi:hypothetical protein
MRSIQTTYGFSLSAVKPLESLQTYRSFCISESRKVTTGAPAPPRETCPSCDAGLTPFGSVEGLDYVSCPQCATFLLRSCARPEEWAGLLQEVTNHKRSPAAFHSSMTVSRNENVYLPKLEWIQHTLRLHGLSRPRIVEFATPPSVFFPLLSASGIFEEVLSLPEYGAPRLAEPKASCDAAVLLESLDRSTDPGALLRNVAASMKKGGLLFLTALVSSGFDVAVLGLNNLYVYPPDRANCFSLRGLVELLKRSGFIPVEISTPGVLDVEIVNAHAAHNPSISLSPFERQILSADPEKREAFQTFLQENLMSSFARIVAKLS